jgi:hypothetical protein
MTGRERKAGATSESGGERDGERAAEGAGYIVLDLIETDIPAETLLYPFQSDPTRFSVTSHVCYTFGTGHFFPVRIMESVSPWVTVVFFERL